MINREDFNGKKYEEMMAVMEQELVLYHDTLNDLTTLEACKAE